MDIPDPLRFEDDGEEVDHTEDDLIDKLCELIVSCKDYGIDFENALRIARIHAAAEVKV